MKLFSGFRSACKIANPIANQCAILPLTFHSSRTRECARATTCSIPASASKKAPVNTREKECGSEDKELAGALGGKVDGFR